MFSSYKLHIILLLTFISYVAFSAELKWKPYGEAKIETQNSTLNIQFVPSTLSGIQAVADLEKGKHKMSTEVTGKGRVFMGIYSNKKWIYSPDFKLDGTKQLLSVEFEINIKGKYLVVLLARKNSCKSLQVNRIWISSAEGSKTVPATSR